MQDSFDPYRKWLGIPPGEQPPNHYRLLGLGPFEPDPDVIANAADARMVHLKTFQGGRHSELSQRILNEVAAAKLCLLNAEKKAGYDMQLRQRLNDEPAAAPKPPLVPPPPQPPPPQPPLPKSQPDAPAVTGIPSLDSSPVASYVSSRKRRARIIRVLVLLGVLLLLGLLIYYYGPPIPWSRLRWAPAENPLRASLLQQGCDRAATGRDRRSRLYELLRGAAARSSISGRITRQPMAGSSDCKRASVGSSG